EALAGRIRDLLASEGLRRGMGFQGRQRVLEDFSFPAQAEGYRELLAELTRSEPRAAVESAARREAGAEGARELSAPPDLTPRETTCTRCPGLPPTLPRVYPARGPDGRGVPRMPRARCASAS